MTEAEWLASTDPAAMLRHLKDVPTGGRPVIVERAQPLISDRKLRLLACAFCRQVWHLLTGERSRKAVEVAERYADGEATLQELMTSHDRASRPALDGSFEAEMAWRTSQQHAAALTANNALPRWFSVSTKLAADQAAILRGVVGNPYRPVNLTVECDQCGGEGREHGFGLTDYSRPCRKCPPVGDGGYRGTGRLPSPWLTPTVLSLAQACYDERLPAGALGQQRLAVLADALEEGGCTSEEILRHLRSPGPHVRGCWAVDLILGKS